MNRALGPDINRIIHVVGKNGAERTLQQFRQRVKALKASIEPVVADGGFRAYVRSDDFQRFLRLRS